MRNLRTTRSPVTTSAAPPRTTPLQDAPPACARERQLHVDSPIGALVVTIARWTDADANTGEREAVTELRLPAKDAETKLAAPSDDAASSSAEGEFLEQTVRRQLAEWFAGERRDFDLPLAPRGTPFQRAVWAALLDVRFGQTTSYATIADAIGRPKACRAVGAANGRNPIPLVVPCHRIIGANGALTGYGGGLPTKRWLLRFEASVVESTDDRNLPDTDAETREPLFRTHRPAEGDGGIS
jgi:methylated-DNA-[protein]-cysteine S-methyltransferase